MLFKLAIRNIGRSVRDYAVYFFTLIIGVAVFYIFNAIGSQTVMLEVSKNTQDIIRLMESLMAGISVFVSFVLGFLIVFASRFLMKRRNKEFGLYLMLGMGRRKVSLILFFETVFIGLISLVVGLVIGVGLSQIMSAFVADMFKADLRQYTFVFSKEACEKTILYFAVIYVIVVLFQTIMINRCKLIDLLQSSRRNEKVRMKNPWLCVCVFIIAVTTLGFAYYQVTAGVEQLVVVDRLWEPISLGCVGSFLFFWSLSGLLLKLMQSRKRLYYKELNSFTVRQISSKVNTTVFSMTIISIMLFVTICVFSSAMTIRNAMNANIESCAPADIQLFKEINRTDHYWKQKGYTEEQIQNADLPIFEILRKNGVDLQKNLKEYACVYMYGMTDLTWKNTLGDQYASAKERYPYLAYDSQETIMKLSDFNALAGIYGQKTETLKENQYLIVADYDMMVQLRNGALKGGEKLQVFGHELSPKYDECVPGILRMSSTQMNTGVIVVPDAVLESEEPKQEMVVGNYNVATNEEKQKLEEKINEAAEKKGAENFIFPDGTSYISIIEATTGLSAMATFIGLYLGIIFLITSAAILALKELSESADNVERYRMLRKLGADDRMIEKALFRQIGIFFLCPLALAVVDAVFGIRFCDYVLATFAGEHRLNSIVLTAGLLILIYGGYFAITYVCSRGIIRERR